MTDELILGRDFLKSTDVFIQKSRIEVRQPSIENVNIPTCEETTVDMNNQHGNWERFEELNYIAAEDIEVKEPYRSRIEAMMTTPHPKNNIKTTIETGIVLKDQIPVQLRSRRLALKEKDILDSQINEETGVIKHSQSKYVSLVIIMRKKDGSSRVCIDNKSLNKKIICDKYFMPLIKDALVSFRVFSVVDLKNGFFHVPVEANNQKYTVFVTSNGQYKFTKTPFELSVSPTSFLRFINKVFRDLIRRKIVFTYMDDIIISGYNKKDVFNKLSKTLTVAANNSLNKLEKMQVFTGVSWVFRSRYRKRLRPTVIS